MIKGILFDFDGVVIDSEPLHYKSFIETLKPLGISFDEKRWYAEFAGTGSRTILKKLFEEYNLNEDISVWLKKRRNCFLEHAAKGELKTIKGAVPFLESIRKKGIKTAISSSGSIDYILVLLEQFQLRNYFDEIVSAEDITKNKPDPEIFLTSARKLNLQPDECLVVEDSRSGIAAGKAAGMKVICISSPTKINNPIKIKDFTEFPLNLLA